MSAVGAAAGRLPFRLQPVVVFVVAIALAAAVGAAGGAQAALTFLAVLAGLGVLLIAIGPDLATYLVIGLIYSNTAVVLVTFHGLPVFTALVVPLLLVVPLGYRLLALRQPIVVPRTAVWLTLFTLATIVSTLFAADIRSALDGLLEFVVEGIGIYLLVVNVVRDERTLRRVVWTLLVVGALLGGLSLFQQLTGTTDNPYLGFAQSDSTFTSSETAATETRQARLAGPIGEQNRYAQIMLMLVPLGLMIGWAEPRRRLRAFAFGAAFLSLMGAVLTFSRGAIVGFAIVIVVMAILRYIRVGQLLAIVLAGVIVVAAVPQLSARLSTLEGVLGVTSDDAASAADNSLQSRATENIAAALVYLDHPVIGVGPSQFSAYYRAYAAEVGVSVRAADREAHNLYLGIAAELGTIGLAAFLLLVGSTLVELARARRRWLRRRPDLANLATGFSLLVVTYLATGLFLHLSYARYFWLAMALAAAAATVLRSSDLAWHPEIDAAGGRAGTVTAATPGRAASPR